MRLHPGTFLGHCELRRCVGELQLAELQPTVEARHVRTHVHEDAHLVLVTRGRYVSTAAGMPPVADDTVLVLNPPGTEHRDHFERLDGRFLTISMSPRAGQEYAAAARLPGRPVRLGESAVAHALLLRHELRTWDASSPLATESLVAGLCGDAAHGERGRGGRGPGWLERARARLDDDPLHTPALAELARDTGVHPVYFSRAFRRRYGCSPGEYLRRRRLERAIGLLRTRRVPLAQVAVESGHADQPHFTRAFARRFGISPGRFRSLLG